LNNQDDTHHVGGVIEFGKNGKLYVATGDSVGGPTQALEGRGKRLRGRARKPRSPGDRERHVFREQDPVLRRVRGGAIQTRRSG
jgi:glucose/arabinose dehydrogenase